MSSWVFIFVLCDINLQLCNFFVTLYLVFIISMFVYNFVPTAGFFCEPRPSPWAISCADFMPAYATHEENSIDAQKPNHTCLLKLFVFVAWLMPAKSKVLDFGPWTRVLGPCPWALSLLLTSLVKFDIPTYQSSFYRTVEKTGSRYIDPVACLWSPSHSVTK